MLHAGAVVAEGVFAVAAIHGAVELGVGFGEGGGPGDGVVEIGKGAERGVGILARAPLLKLRTGLSTACVALRTAYANS